MLLARAPESQSTNIAGVPKRVAFERLGHGNVSSHATLSRFCSAGLTLTLTSMLEPSRLMIDMSRSTVSGQDTGLRPYPGLCAAQAPPAGRSGEMGTNSMDRD